MKLSYFLCLIAFNLSFLPSAQVTLSVTVNSTSVGTTCDDGEIFGTPLSIEPAISLQIDGQDPYYYELGDCPLYNQTAPFNQYSNIFNCSLSYPSTIQVCMKAYEEDGLCSNNSDCLEQLCQNYAVPAPGSSSTYTISIVNDGFNASWGYVNFTITATGSFLNAPNDLICNAINLGTLTSGSIIGNNALSNYSNFCSSNAGDPSPSWANNQGVWFKFTTGSFPSVNTIFNAMSDPQNFGNTIDLQLALYESSDTSCTGVLTLIQDSYTDPATNLNEAMDINCLKPNMTYYLLVDGESMVLLPNGNEGYFGLQISHDGLEQAADEICGATDLGAVPAGGSISTGSLNQSNLCATNTNDPTPFTTTQNAVWYQFQAPISGSVLIDAQSDLPFPIGDDAIDIQLSLFETDNNVCSGNLMIVDSNYSVGLFDEQVSVTCLTAGQNYWVMVDGSTADPTGIFDITVSDLEIYSAGDEICDATDLGIVPAMGSTGTNPLSQTNVCASNTNDPTPFGTTQQAVWYQFIAPATGHVNIDVNSGIPLFDESIDIQLVLYESDNNTCTGNLLLIDSLDGVAYDVDLSVGCLTPGQSYWVMIDGSSADSSGLFDITVADVGTPTWSDASTDTQTVCDSLTWLDGSTYTSDNNSATFVDVNTVGCDSIITLDLTVLYSTTSMDIISECDEFTWIDGNTYTSSTNTPTYIVANAAGCDSTITLDLIILDPTATITQTGSLLSADQTGIYQWVDCDDNYAVIVGATNQIFTPTVTGNYAVIVNDLDGCIDTTDCYNVDYTGIEELTNGKKMLVKIIDFMGRETEFKPNTPLIFIYSDGTRERVMKIED
jgi:hypothetical protein